MRMLTAVAITLGAIPAPMPAQAQGGQAARISRNAALGYHRAISGRVTLENGAPAAGFEVRAAFIRRVTGAEGEGSAVTGADGRYEIRALAASDFMVGVTNGGRPYVVPAPIRVDARHPGTGIDFVLRLGPMITVRVRDAETGRGVPGLQVKVDHWRVLGTTDNQGECSFRIGALVADLEILLSQARKREIDAAPGYRLEHTIRLPTIRPATWEVRTYTAPYTAKPVVFRGLVLALDGRPAPRAKVRMLRFGEEKTATTDTNGRFGFPTQRAQWGPPLASGILFRAEAGDLSCIKSPSPEETWSTIVLRLQRMRRPAVSGIVVDRAGKPVAGVPIIYYECFPKETPGDTVYPRNGGMTDAAGRFTLSGLWSAAYYEFAFGGQPQFGGSDRFALVCYPNARYTYGQLHLRDGETRDIGRIVVPLAKAKRAARP